MRRVLPFAAIIIGGRLVFGSFLITTVKREGFFDSFFTPFGLILIVVGLWFLMKQYD